MSPGKGLTKVSPKHVLLNNSKMQRAIDMKFSDDAINPNGYNLIKIRRIKSLILLS